MSKKQHELNANDELLQPSDLALSGGVPVNANVATLFTRENTSEVTVDGLLKNAELEKSVKVCTEAYGGVQHDANGYFIETEI